MFFLFLNNNAFALNIVYYINLYLLYDFTFSLLTRFVVVNAISQITSIIIRSDQE